MEGDDEIFEKADAGASLTYPKQAGNLKKGEHAILRGFPCRIVEISISKAGKHGHAKASIVGIDIFTEKKYEDQCPSSHNMEVPNVARNEYMLIDIDGAGFTTLMDEKNDTREDLKLDEEELGNKIRTDFEADKQLLVTVIKAMNTEKIVSYREGTF